MGYITDGSLLILIFLSLFVPTAYVKIKIFFLVLSLIGVIVSLRDLPFLLEIISLSFLVALFGLLNSFHGIINNAPGAVRVLSVMTVWPILYSIFSIRLNQYRAVQRLSLVMTASLVAIIIYSFLYIGYSYGIVSDIIYFELDQGQEIGFYDEYVEYNLYSISSLLFLFPFYFHLFLKKKRKGIVNFLILFSGLALCIITGRRAVQLIAFSSMLIVIVSESILTGGRFKKYIVYFMFLLLLIYFFLDINFIVKYIIDGFQFNDVLNESALARGIQFQALINGWLDGNIWFGSGNGSHVEYLRSYEMPWAYELTYVYLLFSTGIFGVLFYFGWFGWSVNRLRRALQHNPAVEYYVAPMMSGVIGMIIGAATNPYFAKFDYLWIIMLPHFLSGAVQYQKKEGDDGNVNNHCRQLECRSSPAPSLH